MSRVSSILGKEGPMLSGDLAKKMIDKYSISPEAARKEISRSATPVRKLRNISFDNNQRYVYLDEHFQQPIYYKTLIQCIEKSSKAYYYFIQAMIYHNGYMKKEQLPSYTCSPIKPLKGHKPADKIINDLCRVNLLYEFEEGLFELNPNLELPDKYLRFKAIEIAKKTIISDFIDWAKKINLISYNKGKGLSDIPEFYKLQWGFTAPSYIQGIRNTKSPGFIVADILIGNQVSDADIEFLLKKIEMIRQNKTASPFVPFVIVESLAESSFSRLKSQGLVLGFVDRLFGNEYLSALRSMVNIVENASAIIAKNPVKYFELIDSLSTLEGKASNLKGDVFELAVGYYYSQHAQYMEINKKIYDNKSGKSKEIDVFVKYSPTELKIVECKGYNYPIDDVFITKWLSENIPVIRNWILDQDEYKDRKLTFEIWSTGGFTEEAERILKKAAKSTKKYVIEYFEKTQILAKAGEDKNKNLERIVKNYFLNEL